MKNNFNGIVNVYKEAGFTSFDVVAKLRGIFGQKKIGHTGTLDPGAVGVLPICLGNATKVVELLMDHDKEYVAELLLGKRTDTQDISGNVISDKDTAGITEESVRSVIASFIGEQDQIPPMYSALKVNGQKLYDLARKGVEVERKPRRINIYDIEILEVKLPVIKMRVHCSKGTYSRARCDEIGEKLGCGGTMMNLERTRVGVFGKEDALTLSEIQNLKDTDRLGECVKSVDSLFMDLPAVTVNKEALSKLENGNILDLVDITMDDTVNLHGCVRAYKPDGTFSALYRYESDSDIFRPEKMFL
jgi:tRNA pseudouridine55 synthase